MPQTPACSEKSQPQSLSTLSEQDSTPDKTPLINQFQAIINSSDDAIISKTLDGTILSWNKAAEKIFGYTAEEMIGEKMIKVFPPDRLTEEDTILTKIAAGKSIEHFKTVRVKKNGEHIHVSVTISPIHNSIGEIVGASKIARDITHEIEAEQTLKQFHAIVESSDDAIISKTLTGTVTSWNKAAEKIFGYTAEEMIGQKMITVFPADRLFEEDLILAKLAKGESIEHFRTVRLHKNGQAIPMSVSISPIYNDSGEVTGASKIARDISLEVVHSQELACYKELIDSSVDAIISESLDGIIQTWNQAATELFGYTASEIIGQPITILFPPTKYKEETELTKTVREGENIKHYRTTRLHKDGSTLYVSVSVSAMHDEQGNILGFSKIIRDIQHEIENEAMIKKQANFDSLTQLRNRSSFTQYIKKLIPVTKYKQDKFALLFIDLDNFKYFNDSYGHEFGDKVLIKVSELLKQSIRHNDEVARLGGDEFVICLTGFINTQVASKVANQIIKNLNEVTSIDTIPVELTASIGCSIYPDDACCFEHMLKHADQAMYQAKEEGKNRSMLYSE